MRHGLFSKHICKWAHIWEYKKYDGSNEMEVIKTRERNFLDSLEECYISLTSDNINE
jgi:hypothetical protein